jgi:spoIIIJ-associated protein
MPNQNVNLNVSAKSVDEAIELGLTELGVSRDQVEIEVISEGKRGIFGLGSEDAMVRLSLKKRVEGAEQDEEPTTEPETPAAPASDVETAAEEKPVETGSGEASPDDSEESTDTYPLPDSLPEPIMRAKERLEQMLELMGVEARVESRPAPDLVEEDEEPPIVLDIVGKDLGVLIGRRSETLQAMQYMVRLMVSKDMGSWQRIVVDVESYRSRRRKSLQRMARRMAERATNNHERVVLEAMTPYERRIIHITLRDHPAVYTKSIGQDNNRKVTIIPK